MAPVPLEEGENGPTRKRILSRGLIIEEAHGLLQEEGVGALSIRKLASRLSVSPMALYRHVDDKQDLLEGILSRIIEESDIVGHSEPDWRAWMIETCVRMRRSMSRRAEIFSVLSDTDRMTSAELDAFNDVLTHLMSAGLSEERAAKVFRSAISFTFGSLAFEGFKLRKLTNKTLPTRKQLSASHPAVARAARHLSAPLSSTEFKAGLQRIVEGY